MDENQAYRENGFKNRDEYLCSLADRYGISNFMVYSISEMLGENEDFEELVTTLEDYCYMLPA